MLNARTALEAEKTLDDGNCALNAFALGLIDENLLADLGAFLEKKQIDPDIAFSEFILKTADKLNVYKNWKSVCVALLRLRAENKEALQRLLAPILRDLVIMLMKKEPDEDAEITLKSAFRQTVYKKVGIDAKGPQDDIYCRHPAIVHEFDFLGAAIAERLQIKLFPVGLYNELRLSGVGSEKLNQLESQLDEICLPFEKRLVNWWHVAGQDLFLDNLQENSKWLGYQELSRLAAYFLIDLDAYIDTYSSSIYFNKLKMERKTLTPVQVEQLKDRSIIEHPIDHDERIVFLPFASSIEIENRLRELPLYKEAKAFFADHLELKKVPVPESLFLAKEQLRLRNIIEPRGDKDIFIVDPQKALSRIEELSGYEAIVAWWDKHYCRAPKMVLSNPRAVHWENMRASLPKAIIPREEPWWPTKSMLRGTNWQPSLNINLFYGYIAWFVALIGVAGRLHTQQIKTRTLANTNPHYLFNSAFPKEKMIAPAGDIPLLDFKKKQALVPYARRPGLFQPIRQPIVEVGLKRLLCTIL